MNSAYPIVKQVRHRHGVGSSPAGKSIIQYPVRPEKCVINPQAITVLHQIGKGGCAEIHAIQPVIRIEPVIRERITGFKVVLFNRVQDPAGGIGHRAVETLQ